MPVPSGRLVAALLLVLGLSTAWFAWTTVPSHGAPDFGYSAWELTTEDGELRLENDQGTSRHPSTYEVDDQIACLSRDSRRCEFEYQAVEGEGNASFVGGYRYVYYHDNATMFELEREYPGDRFAGYEPVEFEEAFSDVAVSPHRLTYTERQLLDGGTIVTDDRLPHGDTIVRHDGSYYTFVVHSKDSPLCIDNAPEMDFCETADSVRSRRFAARWGGVLVGLLGAVLGGVGLGRSARACWRGR